MTAKINGASAAQAISQNNSLEFVPQELIVRFKPGAQGMASAFGDLNVEIINAIDPQTGDIARGMSFAGLEAGKEILVVKLPEGASVQAVMEELQASGQVQYVERNQVIYMDQPIEGDDSSDPNHPVSNGEDGIPNEISDGADLWGLVNKGQKGGKVGEDINAAGAWDITTGNKDSVVAVIDTGIDSSHRDLKDNMWVNTKEIPGNGIDDDGNGVVDDVYGYNAYDDSGDPMDGHGHGTHCAGTIGATGDNATDVVGVNWNTSMMAVKIFSDRGRTTVAAILRGIAYATKMGADITSNSWGGGSPSEAIKDAFATDTDTLHIMAAGNNGRDIDRRPMYPASYDIDNNVSVAAMDRFGKRANFSNYGKKNTDVVAPGVDTLSTVPGNGTKSYSGTSMATPHVSGVSVLIHQILSSKLGRKPTPQEVKDILYTTAKEHGDYTGHGLVDAGAAAKKANDAKPEA